MKSEKDRLVEFVRGASVEMYDSIFDLGMCDFTIDSTEFSVIKYTQENVRRSDDNPLQQRSSR